MPRPNLHHIAERVINRPLLLHPDKASIVLDVLQGRLSGVDLSGETPAPSPEASRFFGSHRREGGYGLTPAANGVAVVSVVGSLVNRGAWVGAYSGLVSYEGLSAQLEHAARDPEVRTIVLDLDSGGGEALGVAALAAKVRQVNAEKPVVAVVNDVAASAAYWIASAASRIVVSPTSLLGSIGVVLIHTDHSAELAERGVAVTLIHAGSQKVDGHPFGPLSDKVRSSLQSEVDKLYAMFLADVAVGRGARLSADAARATEARTYHGTDAIDVGLADAVASFDEIVADLAAGNRPDRGSQQRSSHMADNSQTPAATSEKPAPAATEASTEALATARTEGAAAERSRIASILTHEAAKGREGQAQAIALNTDMTAEQAAAVLEAAPQAAAPAAAQSATPSIEERAKAEEEIGHAPKAEGKSRLVSRAQERFTS